LPHCTSSKNHQHGEAVAHSGGMGLVDPLDSSQRQLINNNNIVTQFYFKSSITRTLGMVIMTKPTLSKECTSFTGRFGGFGNPPV
jgi:hypothetical protein